MRAEYGLTEPRGDRMKAITTKGLVEVDELDVKDIVTLEENARVIATEWRLKSTGELVRRDVNVNILVGHLVGGQQSQL